MDKQFYLNHRYDPISSSNSGQNRHGSDDKEGVLPEASRLEPLDQIV